jgi:hypothetical protein
MNIQEIRTKYPQYSDLPDQELVDGFHQKFYSDMPKDEFYSKVGLKDNNGVWEGLVKPTLKATGRVVAHTAASFGQMPISGVAALGKLISSGGDLNAANKVLEENQAALDNYYLTTPEERKGAENIGLAMKPFQMAGEGLKEIVKQTPLEGTIAEPIAGTIGEAAAMFGLGGAKGAIKGRLDTAFRPLENVIPETPGAPTSITPEVPRVAKPETITEPTLAESPINTPVPKKARAIPENAVARILQDGGINFGQDYQKNILKQYPDLKRVSREKGMSPDAAANMLREEGYDIKSGDDLIEKLKTSEGRNILNPEKQDTIMNRKIKGLENDYIKRELANLDEKIDTEAITESHPDIQRGVLETLRIERDISPAQEETVLAELSSFFSSLPELPKSSRAFVSDMEAKGQAMVDAGLFKEKQTEIPIIDEETYLAQHGASRQDIGDAALHKNIPEGKIRKKLIEEQATKDRALIKKREQLREEYKKKIESGEIRPPTRKESLIATANGHPDNAAVQAARRILEKRGIDWKQTEIPGAEAKNTFNLANPETEISPKLSEQVKPKNAELPIGPGAKTVGSIETPSDMAQLTSTLEGVTSPKMSLNQRLDIGAKVATSISKNKDIVTSGFERVKGMGAALWDAYKNPPEWTTFDNTLGQYIGAVQKSSIENRNFALTIKSKISDPLRREALTNWLEADGNRITLAERFKQSLEKSNTKRHAKGYEAAIKLTPAEETFAHNVKNYFDAKMEQALDAEIIEHTVDNYVEHFWKKENEIGKSLRAQVAAGKLQINPAFAKKRIFESYFEGEQLGYNPTNKDIGYIVGVYDRAFNEAIAARGFIKSLTDGKAKDGRPLVHVVGGMDISLSVKEVKPAQLDLKQVNYIKPTLKPEEVYDYKPINHPALRNWKWIGNDVEGNSILLKGDMYIHPEIYNHMRAVLERSAVRDFSVKIAGREFHPGAAVLSGIGTLKGTLLSLSGFHQVQEGIHAVFHKVNPVNTPKIDLTNPIQSKLIDHGLMVSDYKGLEQFAEGLTSGQGLTGKIPVLGPLMQRYGEYLFRDYIPRLKMKMATEAYERNVKRYEGKISDDQIMTLTANQSNAAFGELNYKQMGRHPSTQDTLRLLLLAPDFLEARGRFTGQAIKPYGREQFMAMVMRGAVGLYVGNRIANAILNDGDAKWDKPFTTVIKGHEFTLRTVPGDIYHLINDPRSFVYYRINPALVKPIVEGITKRDEFGRYRDFHDQVKDYFSSFVPIPLQAKQGERKIWESALRSIGVNTSKERSTFERALIQAVSQKNVYSGSREDRDRYAKINTYIDELKSSMQSGQQVSQSVKDKFKEDLQNQKLYVEDIKKIVEGVTQDSIANKLNSGLLGVEDIMPIWSKTTKEEKAKYLPVIAKKLVSLANNHPQKFQKMAPEITKTFAIN